MSPGRNNPRDRSSTRRCRSRRGARGLCSSLAQRTKRFSAETLLLRSGSARSGPGLKDTAVPGVTAQRALARPRRAEPAPLRGPTRGEPQHVSAAQHQRPACPGPVASSRPMGALGLAARAAWQRADQPGGRRWGRRAQGERGAGRLGRAGHGRSINARPGSCHVSSCRNLCGEHPPLSAGLSPFSVCEAGLMFPWCCSNAVSYINYPPPRNDNPAYLQISLFIEINKGENT